MKPKIPADVEDTEINTEMNNCFAANTNFAENFLSIEQKGSLEVMISLMKRYTLSIKQLKELSVLVQQKERDRLQYCFIEGKALNTMPVSQYPLKSDKRCSNFFNQHLLLFATIESDCTFYKYLDLSWWIALTMIQFKYNLFCRENSMDSFHIFDQNNGKIAETVKTRSNADSITTASECFCKVVSMKHIHSEHLKVETKMPDGQTTFLYFCEQVRSNGEFPY